MLRFLIKTNMQMDDSGNAVHKADASRAGLNSADAAYAAAVLLIRQQKQCGCDIWCARFSAPFIDEERKTRLEPLFSKPTDTDKVTASSDAWESCGDGWEHARVSE